MGYMQVIYLMTCKYSDWKYNTDQKYSCPRYTSVSRHHGGPIEGPSGTSRTSQHYRTDGFKGDLIWVPIMPKDASLADSKCNFFQ